MAITVTARTDLISIVVGMFKAAPGANVLSDLTVALEAGQTRLQIATNLAKTNEYLSIYPEFLTNAEFATKLVDNMVGSLVSATAKADAVTLLTAQLNAKNTSTPAAKAAARAEVTLFALDALKAVPTTDATLGAAVTALNNKIEVANYYSVEKQLSGSSLSGLQNVIAAVDNTAASVTTAKSTVDGSSNVGGTFNFTTGIDNLVGAAGNDTFNAVITSTSAVLGALDKVDGGAGTDTINIQDTSVAAGADFNLSAFNGLSITNVEIMNVTANGALGTAGGTAFDVSTISGLTSFVGSAAGAGTATGSKVKAAGTTDVSLTVAGANSAEVEGGKAVTFTAGTGTTKVTGSALTSVTVNKGGASTIDNTSSTGTGGAGTTLKSVTLNAVDANSTITGRGLESVTLTGTITADRTTTITNSATTDHNLTINASSTGTATLKSVVVQNTAKGITINSTGTTNRVEVDATEATSLTLTGTGNLTLIDAAGLGKVATINGSAASGTLTLGDLNAAAVTVTGGSGADSFALQATAKVTVNTNAGNDTVTLKSAIAAGSTINLGAGNDKLLFATGGSVATSTSTVIDAGDGVDSLSANLVNAGNAAQFKNFEQLNLDSTTGLDLALLTGNTISGLTISSTSTTATYQNVAVSQGLTIDFVGTSSGVNTLSFKDVAGTSDAYTITFAGTQATAATAASVKGGTVIGAGIENVNIVSGGTNTWNELVLGANSSARTITITGARNLDLDFTGAIGTTGTNGLSSIDGSAATGRLDLDLTTGTLNLATAGLTVKGGSANDTITLGQKATVEAGAGDDTIVVSANGGTITTGAGADTVNVKAAVAGSTTAPVITTVTDFTVGTDKLTLKDQGTEVFTSTKVDVSTATALFGGTVNALDLALAADGSTNGQVKWFQYAGDTYVVQDLTAGTTLATTDIVVKLTGLLDLSTLTVSSFNFVA